MSKFKVGDKVRILDDKGLWDLGEAGDIIEVTQVGSKFTYISQVVETPITL